MKTCDLKLMDEENMNDTSDWKLNWNSIKKREEQLFRKLKKLLKKRKKLLKKREINSNIFVKKQMSVKLFGLNKDGSSQIEEITF